LGFYRQWILPSRDRGKTARLRLTLMIPTNLIFGEIMTLYLWLAFGGALGTLARFGVSAVALQWFGTTFPWGTLIINVLGSFIMGFFATLTRGETRFAAGPTTRQFVMTGILGGFTTFSSFSLQTLNLARDGDWLRASGNAVGSLVLSLAAVWLGHVAASALR
jgi:CrcB protein